MDIWMGMDVVPMEYGIFPQKLHFRMWLFQFLNDISFGWDYVLWRIVTMMSWIDIWTSLRIYSLSLDQFKWSCWGFLSLWSLFTMIWILMSKKDISVYHRKQCYASLDMRSEILLMYFECHNCGTFEDLELPKYIESNDFTIFA